MNIVIIQELQKEANTYKNDKSKIFKYKALLKAIQSIQKFDKPIESGNFAKQNLENIGNGISRRIDKIISEHTTITNNTEPSLYNITGVGLSRIQAWNKQNIFNLHDLKNAIENKQVKTTHHIDIGIKYYDDFLKRIDSKSILKFYKSFSKILKSINKDLFFEFCGSFRRKCKTCGDIDILISHKYNHNYLENVIDLLTQKKYLIDHLTSAKGGKKYMGVLMLDFPCRIDIRFVYNEEFYTSLLYFTGSKNFNIQLRKKALSLGYTLNEYHLKNNNTNDCFVINSEKDIFDYLELIYVKPSNRNV